MDILSLIKAGVAHDDQVYSKLCKMVLSRNLPRINVSSEPYSPDFIQNLQDKVISKLNISAKEVTYFVFEGMMKNMAYSKEYDPIILIDVRNLKELLTF